MIDGDSFLQLANECLHALFIRSSKQRERTLLTHLSNPENTPENTENLRQELIQLRKSLSAPPQLITSLTDSVSHAQN